jgi:heme exporter protein B
MKRHGPLAALFLREIRVARRIGGGGAMGVMFFLALVTIVPFAVGPDLNLLSRIGPAILWIAALLATLLGLDRLFQADHEDGSLDLLLSADTPLELVVLVKCLAHWTATGLPLVVAAPLFGFMLAQEPAAMAALAASLLVGTPALAMIGAIGAALTVTLRRGGLLMAILILPLAIPILIFGVSAASAATSATTPFVTPFLILCALSLAALALAPFAAAAALRHMSE